MANIKGSPKTGGRKPGSTNKLSFTLKSKVKDLVESEWETFQFNLKQLDPIDHVNAIIKLCGFVLPKLQAVSISEEVDMEYRALDKMLRSAPDEAINQLAERIQYLKEQRDE